MRKKGNNLQLFFRRAVGFLLPVLAFFLMIHPNFLFASSDVPLKTNFGGYVHKNVMSMRELRYKNIVPQKFDFSCGAASLATILKYVYDVEEADELEITKDMIEKGDQEKIREVGFSLLDMKQYAERQGFKANGYRVKVENLPKIKIPVIVLLNTRGYKHFVVLKGVKKERAYLADPSVGNRSIPMEEFVELWDDVVFVVYRKTDKELTLILQTELAAPVDTVMRLKELGLRNYIRLPGEF